MVERTSWDIRLLFKFYVGIDWHHKPNRMIKSDADTAIGEAAKDLGWFSEQSLPNTWPHNTHLESFVRTLKSCIRASALQSASASRAWEFIAQHAAIYLAARMPAPISPSERSEDGSARAGWQWKENMTCWECHHGGEPFLGPLEPFGRLCYYRDPKEHVLDPPIPPGLFIGWVLETGT